MRINRFLASCGIGSRRKVEEYIVSGRVKVNGKTITDLASTVDPVSDKVAVDDMPVSQQKLVYMMVNKPEGVLTTPSPGDGRPTIADLLPQIDVKIEPVGRLDADTTGLLILTNDGDLAHRMSHPSFQVGKTYAVTIKGKLEREHIRQLELGVWLAEGRTSPAQITNVKSGRDLSYCEITVHEGFNRQIRRMFAKVELKVRLLVRISVGSLTLGDLPIGKIRELSEDEVALLKQMLSVKPKSKKPVRNKGAVTRAKQTPRSIQFGKKHAFPGRRGGK
ncbi:MAG: pseudouridine synthase [Candidatus Brocadiia bacterium]